MKIFYDTEFLENGKTIELISIGMVREDGKEYYAVNADMPWSKIRRHAWLSENVVPHLPTRTYTVTPRTSTKDITIQVLDTQHKDVKKRKQIRNEVSDFFLDACIAAGEDDIELWSWYSAYDHVALCQLWGPMIDKPSCVPHYTNDVKQEFRRCGNPTPPKHDGAEHNALADAHYHKKLYDFIWKVQKDLYREAVLEALHPEMGSWCDLDSLHKEKN